MFDVNVTLKGSEILGEFIVDSYFFEPSKYEYAFRLIQLYDDGRNDKVGARGYSDNNKVIFKSPERAGIFYIRCFLRDKQAENVRGFNSDKIIIDI